MSATPSLPESMKAIEIDHPGEPEVLVLTDRPLPAPQQGEILVKVAAAGVNRPDVLQRRGQYAPPPGASDIPGLEIAGEVVALGEGATKYAIGDRVCALIAGGGYAEYCKVHESNALPVPAGFSMAEAAAIPETFFTVWVNLFQRGHLKAGETVLIHGGTSGIGTVATLLAKAFCAHVITTVGSEEKRQASLALGADVAINYRSEDFVERTHSATDGRGADVIVDLIAGDYLAKNYQAAAMEGRIVQIGTQNGVVKELNLMPLLLKRLTHTGSTLRSRSVEDKAQIAAELREKVWPLLERGVLKPQIFKTFALEQAAQAHALMESSVHIGKIVLTL
ncbi:Beta-ketoacyl-acyl-carrier-protein synthase I [Serratia entomophila]|uniref:NAD(P)H-quinone oxidoreductase n=1 Tax=Serratia entomophila TaxID=42906 RepID=UPI002179220B|nr:NAD(P)H-quinone oxidoreductase [Serratia entomophila]CAI0819862.1 Beta-ketoacyl-acyl-carrier-protein synthase I [Serratia entomophila]CAI0878721.1 Beta-ketoacyl-acyl-carrier-protein synthase I [Serratia entomophila]CAI1575286.1 Beta-ketoacyl-acyl-carrier-protein synthase I [Serratia entomophila]CAI2048994.1 Beta-ketoacyl-acyl-carrier-protein synthase I [Serratia entomophila]CAI2923110.1 Beta-ketoacyl-acyl-carrier-protein synthase I [Serratia entomophila]